MATIIDKKTDTVYKVLLERVPAADCMFVDHGEEEDAGLLVQEGGRGLTSQATVAEHLESSRVSGYQTRVLQVLRCHHELHGGG